MNNIKIFRIFGILTIISLYFLILVGGIVRATGSGMGCPDWPKCFGHYIPPSDISEVSFKQNHSYSKKVFIIHEGKLYYSKSAFVSSNTFNSMNWQQFEEHSYAVFNATHTWIEAFNRYIGVFVGLFVLGLFIYSWLLYKKHGRMDAQYNYLLIMRYSLVALVFVIIQGIIGKYLVSTHLKLKMLTLHMLFSYTVLFAVIYVLYNTSNNYFRLGFNKGVYNIIQISILLTGIQTVLGTQVTSNAETLMRQGIDRVVLVDHLNYWFYIHRSFSILLVASTIYMVFLLWKSETNGSLRLLAGSCLMTIFMEVFLGITLNYWGYPKLTQPLHLLFGTILAGQLLYLYIIYQKRKQYQTT